MILQLVDPALRGYVIYPDGSVLEGRGWGIVGAHTKGHNSTAHGFCSAGNFMEGRITDQARDAGRELWQAGTELGMIAPEYELRGHRDVESTECPGDTLYKEMPHFLFV